MHSNRLVAVLFFCLGGAALAITSVIIHNNGVAQAATADGKWALGWAAIVVHVGGVVVFGLATGAAIKGRQWIGAILCSMLLLGAALYSAWNIASFATGEVVSVTKAREAAEKRADARTAAAIEAAKERRKAQADLAKEQLRWLQGTTEETRGRASRKDYVEAGSKLIADIGKGEPVPLPEAKAEAPAMRSDALAEWLAGYLGWQLTALQASPTLWLALMLILIEVVSWPLASYFWRKPTVIELQPVAAAPVAVQADPPPAATIPPPDAQKALPAPETAAAAQPEDEPPPAKPSPHNPPPPQQPRQPQPFAVQALQEIGFPLVRPSGHLRAKEEPKVAARRFAVWLQAMGLHGTYSATEIATLYREFAVADHREPVSYNHLAAVLEKARGVNKVNATIEDGKRALRWVIARGKFQPKAERKALPEKDEPEAPPALTPSKQAEHIADREQLRTIAEQEGPSAKPRPFGVAPVLSLAGAVMRPDGQDLAWLHYQQKAWRRQRIETRHQHGRRGRRSAA